MIKSFGSKETEFIWEGNWSSKLPEAIQEIARRKLRMLHNSVDRKDLTIPPSNRLEKLKGEMRQFYCIRINDQWRIKFKWIKGHAYEVEIIDYH
jgi:proteic killer suppression protein